jgi:hypothetical protein
MKEYSTQERLAKISELLDKLNKHYHELDMQRASWESKATLENLARSARNIAARLEPWESN